MYNSHLKTHGRTDAKQVRGVIGKWRSSPLSGSVLQRPDFAALCVYFRLSKNPGPKLKVVGKVNRVRDTRLKALGREN